MSRIADVLRKAREENATPARHVDPSGPSPRSISDVKVPWSLRAEPARPAEPTRTDKPTAGRRRGPPADKAVTEAVSSLVRALFLASDKRSTRHVLFTSVDDSPGAADVVIQIAVALAEQSGGPVYLVDMDLNHPSLHLRFDLEGKAGFADALKKDGALRDYSYKAESAGDLWVMPAGLQMGPASPARVLPAAARPDVGDAGTRSRIATLIDTPDYVIAYTAAIGSHSDAGLIGRLFDGVVLVVQAGATTAEATRRAATAVKASKSRLLGTVLDSRAGLLF